MSRFETTRWSVVHKARDPDSEESRKAYAYLCEAYWTPLYAFVRRKGYRHEDARDFTQELMTRVLEKGALAGVDAARGKFRAFLLASMTNLLSDERSKMRAKKRIPQDALVSIDDEDAAAWYDQLQDASLSAERLFDREWGMTILRRAFDSLRNHYAKNGRSGDFDALSPYLTTGGHGEPYAELSVRMGKDVAAIKTAVHRMRARYRDEIRRQVADTVSSDEEFEAEMRHFFNVFAGRD